MTARNGTETLRRLARAACVLLALAGLAPVSAQAQTVTYISNVNQPQSAGRGIGVQKRAQTFRTGSRSGGYPLQDVVLRFQSVGTGTLTVTIGESVESVVGGNNVEVPSGDVLYTLANPAFLAEGLNTFTAPPGATLQPDTVYHIVAESSGGTETSWRRSLRSHGADSGQADGWNISFPALRKSVGQWNFVSRSYAFMAQVRGAATPSLPAVAVTAGTTPVTEGTSATFTVTRTAVTAGALTVRYGVSESGDMVASDDEGAKSVAFGDGDTEMTVTVPTVGDAVHEADSAVTVTLEPDAAYSLGTATAEVTVEDDDNAAPTGAPTIDDTTPVRGQTLTADASGIADADGTAGATFTWRWIRVASGGGETEVGTGRSYTVVDADRGSTLKVEATFTDDDGTEETIESEETAAVELPAVVTPSSDGDVTEGDPAVFTLMRTGSTAGTLRVKFDIDPSGGDFGLAAGDGTAFPVGVRTEDEAVFPAGSSTVRVSLSTVDDNAHEADGTVFLTVLLSDDEFYALGDVDFAELKLRDNDNADPTGAVTIDDTTPVVGETLAADASGVDDPDGLTNRSFAWQWIRVASGGTATPIGGATAASYTVVAADVGATLKAEATFTDDDGTEETVESAETATVNASETLPELSIADASAAEGDSGDATMTFTVTLDSAATQTVTVDWETTDGTATAGTDYAAGNGTLTFGAGDSSKTVSVTVAGDSVDEPNETFTVTLSGASGATVGDGAATGTITDDDATPKVTLVLTPDTIAENGGASTVTARLDHPSSRATTVTVTATPVPPAAAGDYALSANRELTIAAGETASSGVVTVTPVNDQLDQPNKRVTVSAAATNALGITAPQDVTLTIRDDENAAPTGAPMISDTTPEAGDTLTADASGIVDSDGLAGATFRYLWFRVRGGETQVGTGESYTVLDADVGRRLKVVVKYIDDGGTTETVESVLTGTVTEPSVPPRLTLHLDPASVTEAGGTSTVTASLDRGAGRETVLRVRADAVPPATASDFTLGSNLVLRIQAGRTESTGQVTVTAVDNAEDGPDGMVSVSAIHSGPGSGVDGPEPVTLTIEDDDDPPPGLSIRDASVDEGDSGSAAMRFTVTLSPAATGTVTVDWATADGTATAGADYTAGSGSLTFDDGDASKEVSVPVTGDNVDEAAGETFTVTLSGAAGATIGDAEATGTIRDDDDTPTVTLHLSPDTIAEAGGVSTVTASLDHPSGKVTTVFVSVTPVAPAVAGDYLVPDTFLSIPAGETESQGTVTITAVDNAVDAPDKTVTVSSSLVSNSLGANDPEPVTLTIEDDDDAATLPELSIGDASAAEGDSGGKTLEFAVTLDSAATQAVTVDWATSDGTATAGTDYTAGNGTLTFGAGDSSRTVSVTVAGDEADEPDETFEVTLTNPSGATLGDATATGTITNDDDDPTVTLVLTPDTITEDGGASALSATLDHASGRDTVVTVSVSPVGPATASDYSLSPNVETLELLIPAGDTESDGTVTITAVDNAVHAPDKTVTVSATAANDAGVTAPQDVTLTITDDDNAAPTGAVTIDDTTPMVGETLTADPSGIDDPDGLTSPSFAWQWLRVSSGTAAPIGGATAATYTVVAGDVGATLKVRATFTDDDGTEETVESAETAAVGKALPTVTVTPVTTPVTEGAQATFRLARTGDTAASLQLTHRISETGDMCLIPCKGATSTTTLPAGQASADLAVFTVDDSAHEADSVVTVTLAANAAYELGTDSAAQVTVEDDDDSPATGSVKVAGTATEGGTLTADTSGISDEDGLDNAGYAWQWVRTPSGGGDADIPGATSRTYVPVYADAGATLKVRVTVTDDEGHEATFTSVPTAAVSALPRPEVTVASDGDVAEGSPAVFTLTRTGATTETLDVAYEVTAAGTFGAATGAGTTTFPANGATVRVSVHTTGDGAHEAHGSVTVTLTADTGADPAYLLGDPAAATATVRDDDNADPTGVPTIDDTTPVVGETLTADPSGIGDPDGLTNPSFAWRWIRVSGGTETPIGGATAAAYTVADADVGAALKAEAGFTDDDGTAETVASAETAPVAPALPAVTVASDGDVTEGGSAVFALTRTGDTTETLDVDYEVTATGDFGVTAFEATLAFLANNATVRVSVPTTDDGAHEAHGSVTLTLTAGAAYELGTDASATATVLDDDDSPATGAVTVTGTATEGGTLTADTSGIADGDGLDGAGYAWQWVRTPSGGGDTDIPGATGATYVPVLADAGATLKVRVTVTDDEGHEATFTSAPTAAVTALPRPEIAVASDGDVTEGGPAVFTVTRTGVTEGALTVRYRVSESGDMVASGEEGAKSAAFGDGDTEATVTVPTVGDAVHEADSAVTVTLTADPAYSLGASVAAEATVADDDNADPTGKPTIDDTTPVVGETLTADPSGIGDPDGLTGPSFAWQWIRTSGGTDTRIVGATAATYTVVAADEGATLKVEASFTDDDGTAETVASAATSAVEAMPLVTVAAGASVTEGAAAAFTLSRTGSVAAELAVRVTVSETGDMVAAANEGTRTVTFGADSATATVEVPTRGDSTDEPDSTVTVTVEDGGDYDPGTPSEADVTVSDDDVPVVTIASDGDVTEGAPASFTLTRNGHLAVALAVEVMVSETGKMVASGDEGTQTVTFGADSATATVEVPTQADAVDEPDSTVTVAVADGSDYDPGTPSEADVAVSDDDTASLAIDSPQADEKDAGATSTLTFTVTLDPVSDRRVTVGYADSGGGTAASGTDHEAVAGGTLTFAPGDSTKTIAVTVTGDDAFEDDETVVIRLSGATGGATIGTAEGTGTIVDDEVPGFSIDSPSVVEGDSGTADLVFTVTLEPAWDSEVSVAWADSGGGTATSGADHAAVAGGTLTFAPRESTKTVTVGVNGDGIDELDETVGIALSGATGGAEILQGTGVGTIRDDDEATLAIDSPRVDEGDAGATSTLTFTVTLDPVSDRRVTVDWADSGGGTAASGTDHEAVAGSTLTFEPGDSERTVAVTVTGDDVGEGNETVVIALSGATGGAAIGTAEGTGTIVDNETPQFSIDSPRVAEGDSGTAELEFTVTLDPVSDSRTTVAWADSGGGTAASGTDHEAVAGGTLTFEPGDSERTVTVAVTGDRIDEEDETVVIALSNPTGGATVATATGTGTIADDDIPSLAIDSPRVDEGDSGTSDLVFTVTLDPVSRQQVTVAWADSGGGTATSGTDHEAVAGGTLAFAPGESAKTVTVRVTGDDAVEGDETVVIALSNPTGGATVGTAAGTGTIVDDEAPELAIDSPRVAEGDSGTSDLVFTVTLTPAWDRRVTVAWADSGGGTATSGTDHEAVAGGTLAFDPGDTARTVTVAVNGDGIDEEDETVEIALSNPTGGATIGTATGAGTIADDEEAALLIGSPEVAEGDSGTSELVFAVTLAPVSDRRVTVDWADSGGGTATSGEDYEAVAGGTLAFAPGESGKTVTVAARGDGIDENDETVEIALSGATGGAAIGTGTGTGTIRDDDEAALSIDSPEVAEGDSGTTDLVFTVTLDPASDREVVVDFAVGGTAEAGRDHDAPEAGSVAFAPGETVQTLSFGVAGDGVFELDETVVVTLSDPTGGALLRRHRGTGVIRNDDARETSGPAVWVGSTSVVEGDGGPAELRFPVTLSEAADGPVSVDYTVTGATGLDVPDGGVAGPAVTVAERDMRATTGTLVFAPGETAKTIVATVEGDEEAESDGLVVVTLDSVTSAAGHEIGTGRGLGIVRDDDRRLSVEAAGEAGTVTFTVALDPPTGPGDDLVTVDHETFVDGRDGVSGLLTFQHGETRRTVEVEVGAAAEVAELELTGSTNVLLPEPRRTEHWLGARPVLSVSAPAPGSVKRPAVGETATVAFTVGLDRPWPAREPLGVGYVKAARDGEGEREESGTLTFERAATEMTVDVAVDGETEAAVVRLNLEDEDAARVSGDRDGWEARYDLGAGRSERRALALKYVLAATGRTVAANIVELVWDRAESHRSGDAGSRATVGGQPLTPGAPAAGVLAGLLGVGGVGGVSGDAAPGGAERRHGPGAGSADGFRRLALPDDRDLLGRTAFALSPGGDGGAAGGPVLWGRGTFTAVRSGGLDEDDDRIGAFSSEGGIAAAHLGLDHRFRDDLLAGVAVSRTVGDVDYAFGGGGGDGGGAVETTLTSAHPYVHWMSPTGLGVWGTAGYGRGSTEIADRDGSVGTDIEMRTVAAGVRDDLASVGGVGLAVKADAFHATVSADGVEGELLEVDAAASRVRLALEGGSRRALADGGELAGVFELGARLDDGDAERGAGADLALGFGYVLPHAGLEVRGRGSALLAHEESGFREWGLGLGLDWDPGVRGRGLRLRLAPSWGAPARDAAEAMWNADPGAAGRGAGVGGASLDARLGYGWGVLRDRAVTTVFGELGWSGDDDRFRLGVEFRLRGTAGPGLELYGERRGDRPDGLVALKGGVAF